MLNLLKHGNRGRFLKQLPIYIAIPSEHILPHSTLAVRAGVSCEALSRAGFSRIALSGVQEGGTLTLLPAAGIVYLATSKDLAMHLGVGRGIPD
jgi:hypothetical protein